MGVPIVEFSYAQASFTARGLSPSSLIERRLARTYLEGSEMLVRWRRARGDAAGDANSKAPLA